MLANAVADAPGRGARPPGAKALNLNVLYAPDGSVAGHLREAAPRAVRRVRAVPPAPRGPHRRDSTRIPRDFEAGTTPGIFEIAGHQVATIICFESAFGYQVRPLVHDGRAGDRRVHEQPLLRALGELGATCRDRADARRPRPGRPVVQAAISGISAVIDADGAVHERTRLFERTVLEATVTATTGETPYVRYGEWVIWLCALGVLGAVVLAFARDRRPGFIDSPPQSDEPLSVEDRIVEYESVAPYGPAPGEPE